MYIKMIDCSEFDSMVCINVWLRLSWYEQMYVRFPIMCIYIFFF